MKIIGIGIATLDIVNAVDDFPDEDSEVRATSQQIRRGGNATNTLVVLSQLGHQCSWGGVLTDDLDSRHIIADLEHHHIDYQYCRQVTNGKTPISYIILNQRNASRTIIHYRNLPEFSFFDFSRIELGNFNWVHFEGRNVTETGLMLEKCATQHPDLPRSLEVEKPRKGIEKLFSLANLLLFSKEYAMQRGFKDAPELLRAVHDFSPCPILTCTWGEEGAWAMDREGILYASPAYPPVQLLDTTGAGDVFNASIIDGLMKNKDIKSTLHSACRLAGNKCGISGIDSLPV